jgi:hypothetical protein
MRANRGQPRALTPSLGNSSPFLSNNLTELFSSFPGYIVFPPRFIGPFMHPKLRPSDWRATDCELHIPPFSHIGTRNTIPVAPVWHSFSAPCACGTSIRATIIRTDPRLTRAILLQTSQVCGHTVLRFVSFFSVTAEILSVYRSLEACAFTCQSCPARRL